MEKDKAVGFQAIDSEGNVIGFISKEELINETKQALYADLAMEQNKPMAMALDETSAMSASDEYEDQLPIATDAPFVRALDADGNPIRISKQSLVDIVRGLLGTVNRNANGLVDKDTGIYCFSESDKPADINSYLMSGFCRVGNVSGLPEPYGILATFNTRTLGNGVRAQLYFAASGKAWVRTLWDNWSAWREL